MEASAVSRLRDYINNKSIYDCSIYHIDGMYMWKGCCDSFKKRDNSENYWNVEMILPVTDYTLWWMNQWITIFPEIEKRIAFEDNIIVLLPNTDETFHKHHFVWTLMRMCYFNNLGYKVYNAKQKNFLETLRFFLIIGKRNNNRFITESTYFNPNIEKARNIFNKGQFHKMWNVFSGNIYIGDDLSFLKGVNGLEKRIKKTNQYLSIIDELTNKDLVGSNIYKYKGDKILLSFYDGETFSCSDRNYNHIKIQEKYISLLTPANTYVF